MGGQYSRILKYELPVIPILGGILTTIVIINKDSLGICLLNPDGTLCVSTIAAGIVTLGTAGVAFSHLVTFSLFEKVHLLQKILAKFLFFKKNHKNNTFDWFYNLQNEMVPKLRKSQRNGISDIESRKKFVNLTPREINAAIHALELHCKDENPEISSQIEYFYSIFILFFVTGSCSFFLSTFQVVKFFSPELIPIIDFNFYVLFFDILIFFWSFFAVLKSRELKDRLRIKLFNSNRKKVIEALECWFQVELPDLK